MHEVVDTDVTRSLCGLALICSNEHTAVSLRIDIAVERSKDKSNTHAVHSDLVHAHSIQTCSADASVSKSQRLLYCSANEHQQWTVKVVTPMPSKATPDLRNQTCIAWKVLRPGLLHQRTQQARHRREPSCAQYLEYVNCSTDPVHADAWQSSVAQSLAARGSIHELAVAKATPLDRIWRGTAESRYLKALVLCQYLHTLCAPCSGGSCASCTQYVHTPGTCSLRLVLCQCTRAHLFSRDLSCASTAHASCSRLSCAATATIMHK
jgi:hypothetical protein